MIAKVSREDKMRTKAPAALSAELLSACWLKLALVAIAGYALAFAQAKAADKPNGKSLFHANCITCHGEDGSGSKLGKRINVADLRSPEVQHQSSADLARVISDGRKNMPAFKNALSKIEIDALARYVREFGAAK
ncbi:MAG: cytochrome c [Candidatus Sulfotelmatobacter sp.]